MPEKVYLPIAQKKEIQESYLRFKDLRAEIRSCDRQIIISDVAKWGGLAAYIFSFFPKGTFAGAAGTAGVIALVGWYWGWECRKDRKTQSFREEAIVNPLKSVGVALRDEGGVIRAYVNSDQGQEEVWPFDDENYN